MLREPDVGGRQASGDLREGRLPCCHLQCSTDVAQASLSESAGFSWGPPAAQETETQGPTSCSAEAKVAEGPAQEGLHDPAAVQEQVLRSLPRGSVEAGCIDASQCCWQGTDMDGPRTGRDHDSLSHQTTMSSNLAAIPGRGGGGTSRRQASHPPHQAAKDHQDRGPQHQQLCRRERRRAVRKVTKSKPCTR